MFSTVFLRIGKSFVISFNCHFRKISNRIFFGSRPSIDPQECEFSIFPRRSRRFVARYRLRAFITAITQRRACASLKSQRIFFHARPTFSSGQVTRSCRSASIRTSAWNIFYAVKHTKRPRNLATPCFLGLSNSSDTKKSNDIVMRVTSCVPAPALLLALLRKSEVEKCSRR